MITTEDILELHRLSIERFGGANGVRDTGLLESAVARPFQTFGGEDLYKTVIEKAAAIMESIIINHPFIDGNKRTGFLAMFAILALNNHKLISREEIAYTLTIKVSTGETKFEQIVEWLKQNTKPL
jgi:death on curing protein